MDDYLYFWLYNWWCVPFEGEKHDIMGWREEQHYCLLGSSGQCDSNIYRFDLPENNPLIVKLLFSIYGIEYSDQGYHYLEPALVTN